MSWKSSIDDVQQSAQAIENDYDIHLVNRAEELNQRYEREREEGIEEKFLMFRWEHSISTISQRIQSLQDSVKHNENDIYSNSVEYPWQRAIAMNKIPYYIK